MEIIVLLGMYGCLFAALYDLNFKWYYDLVAMLVGFFLGNGAIAVYRKIPRVTSVV